MNYEELKKKLDATFHGAVRAVSWKADFDFYAVYQLPPSRQSEDETVILLYPQPGKDFMLTVLDVEEKEDEWVVSTPDEKWSFRHLPEEDLPLYVADMRKAGISD